MFQRLAHAAASKSHLTRFKPRFFSRMLSTSSQTTPQASSFSAKRLILATGGLLVLGSSALLVHAEEARRSRPARLVLHLREKALGELDSFLHREGDGAPIRFVTNRWTSAGDEQLHRSVQALVAPAVKSEETSEDDHNTENNPKLLLVTGPGLSGKTTAIAHELRDVIKAREDVHVVRVDMHEGDTDSMCARLERLVELSTPASLSLVESLKRWWFQERSGSDGEAVKKLQQHLTLVKKSLQHLPDDDRVVVWLDNLDDLDWPTETQQEVMRWATELLHDERVRVALAFKAVPNLHLVLPKVLSVMPSSTPCAVSYVSRVRPQQSFAAMVNEHMRPSHVPAKELADDAELQADPVFQTWLKVAKKLGTSMVNLTMSVLHAIDDWTPLMESMYPMQQEEEGEETEKDDVDVDARLDSILNTATETYRQQIKEGLAEESAISAWIVLNDLHASASNRVLLHLPEIAGEVPGDRGPLRFGDVTSIGYAFSGPSASPTPGEAVLDMPLTHPLLVEWQKHGYIEHVMTADMRYTNMLVCSNLLFLRAYQQVIEADEGQFASQFRWRALRYFNTLDAARCEADQRAFDQHRAHMEATIAQLREDIAGFDESEQAAALLQVDRAEQSLRHDAAELKRRAASIAQQRAAIERQAKNAPST